MELLTGLVAGLTVEADPLHQWPDLVQFVMLWFITLWHPGIVI